MLAIIDRAGLAQSPNMEIVHRQVMRTPYGEPSGALTFGRFKGQEVMFLARHTASQATPPHRVNYRANLWALHEQGAKRVISIAMAGGIRADLSPGTIILPDQLIDYTYGREFTFFDERDDPPRHIDFSVPYTPSLRQQILDAAQRVKMACLNGGVYAAVQGPRLETIAEVNRMERDGADMVGMTGMPEAALARELELNYAAIVVVVNHAAGRGSSSKGISLEKISIVSQHAMAQVNSMLENVVEHDGEYGNGN